MPPGLFFGWKNFGVAPSKLAAGLPSVFRVTINLEWYL